MELVLIRHALPLRVTGVDGPADPRLSEAGLAQAALLAVYLDDDPVTAVYSSPLRRAVETAAPLAARRGLQVETSDGLAEWDRNAAEYVPIEELRASGDPRWAAMVAGEWISDEAPETFAARVVASFDAIIERHPGELVVAVCHGGVINSYLGHVLGRPGTGTFFAPDYTSIHRVAASRRGHRQVMTMNETPHLRGSGLPIGLFDRG
jgi:broad specificity phosphatase PhoE